MNLRFRTRLALVMFLTMTCTTAGLMIAYVRHDRQEKAYTTILTSDLLQIVNLTQQQVPPNADRNEVLEIYSKALKDAGLSSINVALPSGEVVASSNPAQVGKKISLKKRHPAIQEKPFEISAELQAADVDPGVGQKTYNIEFPIVQGEKVLGYVQIKGEMDAVIELLHKRYLDTLALILCIMLSGHVRGGLSRVPVHQAHRRTRDWRATGGRRKSLRDVAGDGTRRNRQALGTIQSNGGTPARESRASGQIE